MLTSMRLLAGVALLLPALASGVPEITIDGRLDEPEWQQAPVVTRGNGLVLRRIETPGSVFLGIQRTIPGAALLLIPAGNELEVGHIGSALGRARYRDDRLISPYRWSLRDPATRRKHNAADTYATEQSEFLADAGWVASTGMMGTPGDLEVRIDRRLGTAWVLVLPLIDDAPAGLLHYPSALPGAVNGFERALLQGQAPAHRSR